MGRIFQGLIVLIALIVAYFLFWPVPVDPVAWEAKENQGYTGAFAANERFASHQLLGIDGGHGPEDVAIGPDGRLYTGLEDGRLIAVDPASGSVSELANTGGRPLGMEFEATGNLIVADAYKGLLSVSPEGRISVLADKAEDGSIIGYADDLDITPDGVIWFSDASTKFFPGDFGGTLGASLPELWEMQGAGRVLRYDPASSAISTVMEDLVFANGVAADPQGRFILVNETGKYRILKYWIAGPRAGETEVLIDNLPGYPDNINRDTDGTYFVGLVAKRNDDLDALLTKPFLRKVIWRIPGFTDSIVPEHYSHLVRLDADGTVLETWQDPAGTYPQVTGAVRGPDGTLYVSSLGAEAIAVLGP